MCDGSHFFSAATPSSPTTFQHLVYEWFLAFWVWIGLRMRGFTVKSLIGGRWNSRRSVFVDLALAVAVWMAMLLIGGVLSRILPPSTAKSTGVLMPQGALEFAIWIAVALTAGFVEELVCRGYLQTQLMRLGLPAAAAIFGQAVLFAFGHLYEGMNAVVVITVYAILLGTLALWRKSLRPGMVGHAWFDLAVVFLVRG